MGIPGRLKDLCITEDLGISGNPQKPRLNMGQAWGLHLPLARATSLVGGPKNPESHIRIKIWVGLELAMGMGVRSRPGCSQNYLRGRR